VLFARAEDGRGRLLLCGWALALTTPVSADVKVCQLKLVTTCITGEYLIKIPRPRSGTRGKNCTAREKTLQKESAVEKNVGS